MISMLTGLKLSSLAWKYLFYKPEHKQRGHPMELNLEGLETKKWNKPTDRAQRVDKKNGVNFLVMFTHGVTVIKISKCAIFCILCWWQQKNSHTLDKVFRCIWKIFFSSFRKCYGLLCFELQLTRCKPLKYRMSGFFWRLSSFLYFYPHYLTNGNSKA